MINIDPYVTKLEKKIQTEEYVKNPIKGHVSYAQFYKINKHTRKTMDIFRAPWVDITRREKR
jgi:hypothetical protein